MPHHHHHHHPHHHHHHHGNRLLFILKKRGDFYGSGTGLSSGLRNSVGFVVEMLNSHGIEANLVVVDDNNSIDRVVTHYRPSHVFIEAFWVVPEKFDVLKRLHPTVHWTVRNHSDIPFLAVEGNAMNWTAGYMTRGVDVNSNSIQGAEAIQVLTRALNRDDLMNYLPNFYPRPDFHRATTPHPREAPHVANIGCFGAIRPLKNQLVQALAAVEFARRKYLHLNFHINSTRIEGNAGAILQNLRAVMSQSTECTLVEHPWLPHDKFLELLDTIDVSMQVSLSESFNIVSADAVSRGVPVVVSNQVSWVRPQEYVENSTSVVKVADAIDHAWNRDHHGLIRQYRDLVAFGATSEELWLKRFAHHHGH